MDTHQPMQDAAGAVSAAGRNTLFDLGPAQQAPPTVRTRPRLRYANRQQACMRVCALDDLLPEDHPVRIVWDHVDALDLSPLLAEIQATEAHAGAPATDPRILMTLWLYATLRGIGELPPAGRLPHGPRPVSRYAADRVRGGAAARGLGPAGACGAGWYESPCQRRGEFVSPPQDPGGTSGGGGAAGADSEARTGGGPSSRQPPATKSAAAGGAGTTAASRAGFAACAGNRGAKEVQGQGSAGLDHGCRCPRDEDGRWRFSTGLQPATGHRHRGTNHHRCRCQYFRRRSRQNGPDGAPTRRALRRSSQGSFGGWRFCQERRHRGGQSAPRNYDGLHAGAEVEGSGARSSYAAC